MADKYTKENHITLANYAIRFLKENPCIACSGEGVCGVIYKGTCPVWRDLMLAFYRVEEYEVEE